MFTLWGSKTGSFCDGLNRRQFLKVGALGLGSLTLPDWLRLRAQGAVSSRSAHKSVIMVYLFGGPSHLDMYDLKPEAPADYRGEFQPIATNVPGVAICELMPRQAQIADKLALIRNMDFNHPLGNAHAPPFLYGAPIANRKEVTFPAIGSVISKLWNDARIFQSLPPYVALDNYADYASWLGAAHRPFVPAPLPRNPLLDDGHPSVVPAGKLQNLELVAGLTLPRLHDRAGLLRRFDTLRRDLDNAAGSLTAIDDFQAQGLAMITDPKVRAAFDLSQEPDRLQHQYGKVPQLLLARRLAEAGVPFVQTTIDGARNQLPALANGWDTHGNNFKQLRQALPEYDQAIYALITDVYQRGLDRDVLIVIWGEFGRTPKVNGQAGRDHWPQAGFTLISGGGLATGQVIGATDPRGARPLGNPYTPQNVLATVYRHLGIDLERTTITDPTGRPHYLLHDPRPIQEL